MCAESLQEQGKTIHWGKRLRKELATHLSIVYTTYAILSGAEIYLLNGPADIGNHMGILELI